MEKRLRKYIAEKNRIVSKEKQLILWLIHYAI